MNDTHPDDVLFDGEPRLPVLSPCDHYAGSEQLLRKALELQAQMGGRFDITADCEDGARAGSEREHMHMVVDLLRSDANLFRRMGVRIHGYQHPAWRRDVEELIAGAGSVVSHITIPKPTSADQVELMVDMIRKACRREGIERRIPVHVLIETLGALRDVWDIARLPGIRVLDFGLMDLVSSHQGAIPVSAMRSPGQFEHPLIARAKTEVVAAALTNGLIPAHNVTLDLSNADQTRADAQWARAEFGFMRMWSIHPAQIEPIIETMQPDFSGLQQAEAILPKAQAAGWGPIQHDGQLHDRGTYRDAWRLVQQARLFGVPLCEGTEQRFFAQPEQAISGRSAVTYGGTEIGR